ncbi:MAG TPA: hypothetical protein VHP13_03875, partial [Gammaproteobacteria bacterium]|nr:hypothetical protein [Gammaproteobacteria bacterium]
MNLHCPHCQKHVFPISSVFMLGENGRYSGYNRPLECPHCGGYSKLQAWRQTFIDLLTLVGCGLAITSVVLVTHGDKTAAIWGTGLAIVFGVIARYLAIRMLAVLVPSNDAPEDDKILEVPKESISPDQLPKELRRLKDDKKTQFSVIFEPNGGYLSLYCRKDTFVVELAFATRALRAREKKFKAAIVAAGAIAKEFDSNGLGGYEATLGSDVSLAADKVHQ